jgi:hypothetical protein
LLVVTKAQVMRLVGGTFYDGEAEFLRGMVGKVFTYECGDIVRKVKLIDVLSGMGSLIIEERNSKTGGALKDPRVFTVRAYQGGVMTLHE